MKEPIKVTRFKKKVADMQKIPGVLDELIAKGYRVEYHVDGKAYK